MEEKQHFLPLYCHLDWKEEGCLVRIDAVQESEGDTPFFLWDVSRLYHKREVCL